MTTFQDWLQMKDACDEAREWVGDRDAETAWRECQRPDWMLWACGRLKLDRKLFVAIACRIAAYAATAPSSSAPHIHATYTTYIGTPASQTKRYAECANIVREVIPWEMVKAAL